MQNGTTILGLGRKKPEQFFILIYIPVLWIPKTLNLDPDPEFWPNLNPDQQH